MQRTNTHDDHNRRSSDPSDRNAESLIRFGLIFAISFLIASTMPSEAVAATLSALLSIGGFVSANVALLNGERVFTGHITRWDEAAALMALSILAGWFVDTETLHAVASAGA